jgi:hypothetical protein
VLILLLALLRYNDSINFTVPNKRMKRSAKQTLAAGHAMVNDANLKGLAGKLGCTLANSSSDMTKTLAISTLTHPQMLMGRQQTILHLRSQPHLIPTWNRRFDRLAEIESNVAPFFQRDGKDKDSLEDDSVAQLSFQHELFKPLNHIPWLLFAVSLFKIWLVPAMSLFLPILMWILPYILLRFVYALPISQDQYMQIIQQLLSGNMALAGLGQPAPVEPWNAKTIFQYSMFIFTFAQSMIQPIQNAMHLYKTDSICTSLGAQILEIRSILREFRADLGSLNGIHVKLSYSLEHFSEADTRMAFISIQDNPANIHMVFRDLAHLECMWRIALSPSLHPVTFVKDKFMLSECSDISLTVENAVTSSIDLSEKNHSMLTGPNGGGKSSFLRAVLQSVLMGHAFGFAPAKQAYMPRFVLIASGLQLRDTPGTYSMFETEVKFAADTIHTARMNGPGLVLFDELFHSTNPPDSQRSAIQFLHRLWKTQETFSVVSTHLFPLVAAAPANVQAVCCHANQLEDGEIEFSFALQPGICTTSSVHKVWERFGLARHRRLRPNSEEQSLNATQN